MPPPLDRFPGWSCADDQDLGHDPVASDPAASARQMRQTAAYYAAVGDAEREAYHLRLAASFEATAARRVAA